MLNHAQGNISEARKKAETNLNESHVIYNESVETQRKAYEARNVSGQFKVSYYCLHLSSVNVGLGCCGTLTFRL